jgi:3-(3-hydroxy-phenyl)propionate hydroxylase
LPAGTPFPQAMGCIEPGVAPQMMDDLLQPGFLLVLRHAPDPAVRRALEKPAASLGAQMLCIDAATTAPGVMKLAEADGILAAWFERHACEAALVRPDHLVYGVARTLEDAAALMQRASRDLGARSPALAA